MNKNIKVKDIDLTNYEGIVRFLVLKDKKGQRVKEIEPTGEEIVISAFEIEPLFQPLRELHIYVKA